jgi:hypothetical protein
MEAIAVKNYNPGSWETIAILGGWNSLAYLAIALAAGAFGRSIRGSVVVLVGTMIISGLSVVELYAALSPYFVPPSFGHRVMNCGGPAEILIPFLQFPMYAAVLLAAFVLREK